MNKLKHIFPHQILRTLYNSLIHPHFWSGLLLLRLLYIFLNKIYKKKKKKKKKNK